MIKEVPTKVFNEAYDNWAARARGEHVNGYCPYCGIYGSSALNSTRCKCPLNKNICNKYGGAYWKWVDIVDCKSAQAKKYAKQVLQGIIDNCVYDTEEL